MKPSLIPIMAGLTGGLLLAGCISHHETVYQDVNRTRVEFENDAAARMFYETLDRDSDDHAKTESTTEVSIPVVFDHKQTVVEGPNRRFNRAVALCDTNRDGKITELEARIYADRKHKHRD